jgi:hypothetical protein
MATKIAVAPIAMGSYTSASIAFALVSSPARGREQIHSLDTCRDFISDRMIATFNRDNGDGYNCGDKIDFEKLRLLIYVPHKNKEVVFKTKEILNMYEKLAGFKKSKIVSLNTEDWGNSAAKTGIIYLLTGPKEWMRCSQLTSFVTILFRVCCTRLNKNKLLKVTNLDEAEALFKEHFSQNVDLNDKNIFNHSWPKFRMIMTWYKEIFEAIPQKDLLPASKVGEWHSPGGISSLCHEATQIPKLDKSMREHWNKWVEKYGDPMNCKD